MVARECFECSFSKSLVKERNKCDQKRGLHTSSREVSKIILQTRGPHYPLSRVFYPFTFKGCPLPISVEGAH
jgi:hypothetical protein